MSETLWTPGEAQHAFATQAPEEVVIVFARRDGQVDCLTRAEFDSLSSRLAHRLIGGGVGPGEYVAIILPNGLEHLVATLAVYKAGGTPMPVSYGMPARERDALLALAGPRCIFCDDPSLEGLFSADVREPGHWISLTVFCPAGFGGILSLTSESWAFTEGPPE